MRDLLNKFDRLEEGDKVQVPQYSNPLEVTSVHEPTGTVNLEGSRGGEKSLVQNKHNPEDIALLSKGGKKKGFVNDFDIL